MKFIETHARAFLALIILSIGTVILISVVEYTRNVFMAIFIVLWSCLFTSHSAYVATETELVVAKIDGLLPPNFL